jgi:hypothetical protein
VDMQAREANLHAALSEAILRADGDAVEAAALLIPAVADFLDVPLVNYGHALPTIPEPSHCPLCGSDDLAVFAADETREDEADLVSCENCDWQAALTLEGRANLDHGASS